ncbi:MAG: phosphoribosylanthranilate isomerase [Firmicutes bacterium]|nr:phosphoribosylanthranilate isomerase [Bacillota bacterium]
MGVLVKICGLTRPEEVEWAQEAGADAVGFVFHPGSLRAVTVERARQLAGRVAPGVLRVGVVVNPPPEELFHLVEAVALDAVQWHGPCPERVVRRLRQLRPDLTIVLATSLAGGRRDLQEALRLVGLLDYLLLDTRAGWGGTGATWDWSLAVGLVLPLPVIVAGGLTPDNVGAVLERLRPAGVDVSTGVEVDGMKDRDRMRCFVRAVRRWERRSGGGERGGSVPVAG